MEMESMARVQTLWVLTFNACGTMVGTGIYTMTGKMAGQTGYATVISYLIGVIPTLLVGAVYAALATRYPKSNSLCHWLDKAWGSSFLSFLGGSSSAGLYMFAGSATTIGATLTLFKWFGVSADENSAAVLTGCVLLLLICLVLNLYGLEETSKVLEFCTWLELGGLFVIIVAVACSPMARSNLSTIDWMSLAKEKDADTTGQLFPWVSAVISGGVFVVFSFGGFETIASQAEEAQDPKHDLPRAFCYSLVIVALLNIMVMVASLAVIPPHELAVSPDALTDVMQKVVPWLPREVFDGILLASAFNTVLGIQIHISRTLWGMARSGALPQPLAWVKAFAKSDKPQPYVALIATFAFQAALLVFGLMDLGKNCASLLVISFMLAHVAYIGVLFRERAADVQHDPTVFTVSVMVPLTGLGTSAFIMYFAVCEWGGSFLIGWLLVSAGIWGVCCLIASPTLHQD